MKGIFSAGLYNKKLDLTFFFYLISNKDYNIKKHSLLQYIIFGQIQMDPQTPIKKIFTYKVILKLQFPFKLQPLGMIVEVLHSGLSQLQRIITIDPFIKSFKWRDTSESSTIVSTLLNL